jgi:hypothetical protein
MKYFVVTAALVALASSATAHALGSLARVSVIDRDTGAALRTYYSRGEYWVAGDPGARYAIEIRNCADGRLLAVTSVDGVNVLTGDTAGVDQAGYVFDSGERYEITGWRKSNAEVAAFTFTDSRDSYAGRTGRPANVGVIGIALFREQVRQAHASARVAPAPAPATPPPVAEDAANAAAGAAAALQRSQLGTGHGEREYSYVVDTQFHRMQPQPSEIIRIRYDSLENLIAMGIVRRPRPTPRLPDPFPGTEPQRFVPDPPAQ